MTKYEESQQAKRILAGQFYAAPPYEGWAKLYVDAERGIPKAWYNDFIDELVSEDVHYRHQLEESVRYFGVHWV
jgi:hypothetical protein